MALGSAMCAKLEHRVQHTLLLHRRLLLVVTFMHLVAHQPQPPTVLTTCTRDSQMEVIPWQAVSLITVTKAVHMELVTSCRAMMMMPAATRAMLSRR